MCKASIRSSRLTSWDLMCLAHRRETCSVAEKKYSELRVPFCFFVLSHPKVQLDAKYRLCGRREVKKGHYLHSSPLYLLLEIGTFLFICVCVCLCVHTTNPRLYTINRKYKNTMKITLLFNNLRSLSFVYLF